MPLTLYQATNVVINGNGCKILITNPRLGFLDVNNSSSVIVENFFVDHEPLPFTQGTVTHNFFTNVPSELAIEFRVDTNYPAPTNANYIDANASNSAERWGTVMNPTNLDAARTIVTRVAFTPMSSRPTTTAPSRCICNIAIRPRIRPAGRRWNMISR